MAQVAAAGLCLASAILWSLPVMASGLLALLRYGFGSIFVVGESVAAALLRSAGADVADTVQRLHANPTGGATEAAAGLLLSTAAAAMTTRQPSMAALLAAASALEAWWYGLPVISIMLVAPVCVGIIGGFVARRG
ncbi:hypothetical protein [Acidisphaera sp. L21]|uniref:hypothetical protein n=1 Tax=Acidisphaera sp. L21 TaxID=1641851 RepID=UPI00131DD7DD|nr:hypothetical protein [Acidisphaera sp. L21]